jgi:predicted Zn-dependent protease with MMP-like domain
VQDADPLLESIYDALDRGVPEEALSRARGAMAREGDDPVLRFLAGMALLELDRPEEAVGELGRAVGMDPDDAEFRAQHAFALFRSCRFAEALEEARRAVEADPRYPDAQHVLGLALERDGRFDEADAAWERAAAADPEAFPPPSRMSREAFEAEVAAASDLLPDDFRLHLGRVAVTVEPIPSLEVLTDADPPLDPELLGLFVGTALPERSFSAPGGDLPPRILLFQRNLERYAAGEETLRDEIRRTLYHELAHYLGFDEEQMEGMDLD